MKYLSFLPVSLAIAGFATLIWFGVFWLLEQEADYVHVFFAAFSGSWLTYDGK